MPRKAKSSPAQALTATRRVTHGPFKDVATTTEALQAVLSKTTNWPALSPVRHMVLKEICHKLARIGAGDPSHKDHWDDIGGYLELGKNEGVVAAKAKKAKVKKAKVKITALKVVPRATSKLVKTLRSVPARTAPARVAKKAVARPTRQRRPASQVPAANGVANAS